MQVLFSFPKLKVYSGLFVIISAAYFMATAISSRFVSMYELDLLFTTFQYLVFGVLYLWLAIIIEEYLYYGRFY